MMKKDRYKIIPASYLVLIKNDKILLLLRKNTKYMDGYYSLIAGHVEENETALECMIREAKEEANIEITKNDIECVHTQYRDKSGRVDFFILCKNWKGELKNLEPDKCGGLEFFDINNLPENMILNVKNAVLAIIEGRMYSEFSEESKE